MMKTNVGLFLSDLHFACSKKTHICYVSTHIDYFETGSTLGFAMSAVAVWRGCTAGLRNVAEAKKIVDLTNQILGVFWFLKLNNKSAVIV